jgi:hypothetical protein
MTERAQRPATPDTAAERERIGRSARKPRQQLTDADLDRVAGGGVGPCELPARTHRQ